MKTLKRISNWPLYKLWYFAIYLIKTSKVWLFRIMHIALSINSKNTCDCFVWNTFNMAKISITELTQALLLTQKYKYTHSRKHDRDVTSEWRHSVGSLPHLRFNRDMMLAKDNTPCHADRSTQVMPVTNNIEHSNGLYNI